MEKSMDNVPHACVRLEMVVLSVGGEEVVPEGTGSCQRDLVVILVVESESSARTSSSLPISLFALELLTTSLSTEHSVVPNRVSSPPIVVEPASSSRCAPRVVLPMI